MRRNAIADDSMTTWHKRDWQQFYEIARRPWKRHRPPRPVYPTGLNRVLPAQGFSLSELDDAGVDLDLAERLGLPVDAGRIGAYGPNVTVLRGSRYSPAAFGCQLFRAFRPDGDNVYRFGVRFLDRNLLPAIFKCSEEIWIFPGTIFHFLPSEDFVVAGCHPSQKIASVLICGRF